MRKYLIKTSLILVPVIIAVVTCEIVLRSVDNDYKYKNAWLTENSPSVELLSLGSSHEYFGIDPDQFDLKAFNAAYVSQDIKYNTFIFNKFIGKMDSLKYVILPVSCSSLFSNLETSVENWRVKYYTRYYDCPYHPFELKFHLEVAYGLHPERVVNIISGKEINRYCSRLGQGKYKLEERKKNWKETGKIAAERHSHKSLGAKELQKRHQTNMALLRGVIETCKQRGIKVIILTAPTYCTYREHLIPKELELAFDSCNRLQNEYDNAVWLNFFDDSRFTEDDYYDADHLNEHGAEKLSGIINEYIKETFFM